MSTKFYADYIKKTTFDPETFSVRSKIIVEERGAPSSECCDAPLKNYNNGTGICHECGEHAGPAPEEHKEAATDTKKKPASKTPKLEVPATEIPEAKMRKCPVTGKMIPVDEKLHGDQDKLDHNKDNKIDKHDLKKVRKHGPVVTEDNIMEGIFKVEVDGLPTMYMDGSAGEIRASLRKKFKDPKAVISIERITPAEKKKELRAKVAEEDLNELDKKTMGSYVKKAVNDLDNRSFTQGMRDNSPKYTSADAKNNAKIRTRRTGIDRAVNKMSEDQAAIDAYLKKGGKITKVPPAKAQGAYGDTSMASGVAGQLSKADTSRFKTQKKVKSMEDVEQVDEISSELAGRAHSSARKQVDYKKTTPTTAKKSDQGTKALAYHQRKAVNPSHTGTSYKGSPGGTDVAAAYKSSSEPARKTSGKYIDKLKKQGIDVSEQDRVDEISKRAKAAYTRVAARDIALQTTKASGAMMKGDRDGVRAADREREKRYQGIDRATKGLQKEGAMKRIATQDAEKERLGPRKVKGDGMDTFKKKYSAKGGADVKKPRHWSDDPLGENYGEGEKDTHVTKDGRTVKKGLWYNMNKRKEAGTSRPKSAGTVSPEAIKKSQS